MMPTLRRNDEDRFPSDPDVTIEVGMTFGWRHNGRRAVSTALKPAYYGVYVQEMDLHEKANQLHIHIQALGEWDLPNPSTSLVCLRRPDESWSDLAEVERGQDEQTAASSRFARPLWVPSQEGSGYFLGCLVLPLDDILESGSIWQDNDTTNRRQQQRIVCLDLAYAAGRVPWGAGAGYPHKTILELDFSSSANRPHLKCPRTKPPVPVTDPWKPIFPAPVEQRFRTRERNKRDNATEG